MLPRPARDRAIQAAVAILVIFAVAFLKIAGLGFPALILAVGGLAALVAFTVLGHRRQ